MAMSQVIAGFRGLPVSPRNAASALRPHLARHFDAAAELGPLLVLGQQVALLGAGEAALRREAELFEGCELRRLVDAALELVLALQRTGLRRHDAQHDLLVLWQETQRLETAGPCALALPGT